MRGSQLVSAGALVAAACTSSGGGGGVPSTKEQVGKLLFEEPALSQPAGQACADCHAATVAFSDPETDHSTSRGATPDRFGPRNSPTAMYARYAPPLHADAGGRWVGGLFWDGRADSLEEQAGAPLLNPLEMGAPSRAAVVDAVRAAPYAAQLDEVFGPGALDDPDAGFAHVTEAIAAYERTATFAPFSSKYDRWLAGQATLTAAEQRGLAIFEDPARGNCAGCHPSRPAADGTPPLFTDFGYANLGIPKYANNMFLRQPPPLNPDGLAYIDHGLMTTVGDPAQDGKFRVPTLRNVARTAPYGHNGYFANLPYLIDFVVTRDVGSARNGPWAAPEVPATVDARIGRLPLSDGDMADLVAFLGTLTDEAPAP